MQAVIKKSADAAEFPTTERCLIQEIANDDDDANVSIARARVPAGVTTAWHALAGVDERYLIISGRGRVEVGELAPALVDAGDVVRIPAGVRQRIANVGAEDLIFYAICSPRFTDDCYQTLE